MSNVNENRRIEEWKNGRLEGWKGGRVEELSLSRIIFHIFYTDFIFFSSFAPFLPQNCVMYNRKPN